MFSFGPGPFRHGRLCVQTLHQPLRQQGEPGLLQHLEPGPRVSARPENCSRVPRLPRGLSLPGPGATQLPRASRAELKGVTGMWCRRGCRAHAAPPPCDCVSLSPAGPAGSWLRSCPHECDLTCPLSPPVPICGWGRWSACPLPRATGGRAGPLGVVSGRHRVLHVRRPASTRMSKTRVMLALSTEGKTWNILVF